MAEDAAKPSGQSVSQKQSVIQQRGQSVLKPPTKKVSVDLVVCIDGTKSMQGCIDAVKAKIKSVVTEDVPQIVTAKEGAATADFRYRLLVFRDFVEDQIRQKEDHDFTANVDEFVEQLSRVEARGGGDEPESMLDALVWAIRAGEYDAGKKFRDEAVAAVALFTDAPSRESLSPDTVRNLKLDELGYSGSLNDVTALFDSVGRALVFVAAPKEASTGQPNTPLIEIARRPNVTWVASSAESLKDVDMRDFLSRMFATIIGSKTRRIAQA